VAEFTLNDLTDIAKSVIGSRRIRLTDEMTARDVPGWDSLNHTLIAVELSTRLGREFGAKELAQARNFGEVIALINARI
jgi:acyl carrier protein